MCDAQWLQGVVRSTLSLKSTFQTSNKNFVRRSPTIRNGGPFLNDGLLFFDKEGYRVFLTLIVITITIFGESVRDSSEILTRRM